mgnify:FL=1|jgi:ribosomal protein S27E
MGLENKIFVENLPMKSSGIDWVKTKGMKVHFIHNGIEGDLLIKDVFPSKHTKLLIKYQDNETLIHTTSFMRCKLTNLLNNKILPKFKYDINEEFESKNSILKIINRKYNPINRIKKDKKTGKIIEYISNGKEYDLKCNKCGNITTLRESDLNKIGCPVCNSKKVVKGVNDIGTTRPDLLKYFKDKEEAYSHTKGSEYMAKVKCPYCGEKKLLRIADLNRYGIGCLCGSGYSYSERFLYNLFKMSNLKFTIQYSKGNSKWCGNYRYDFYLDDYNWIVEAHGEQHYTHSFIGCGGDSIEEVKLNDKKKRNLALENGISEYIELNCSKSNSEYILKEIQYSKLKEIINWSLIDINECDKKANGNIIKIVCDKWNEYQNVSKVLNNIDFIKSRTTIIKYLKKGTELGMCNYNPKSELIKSIKANSYYSNKEKYNLR